MASNLDDIIRQALKAGKSAAKKAGKKTGSVSREARKAANKAQAASTRAAKTEASQKAREARRGWNKRNWKKVEDTAATQRYGTGEFRLNKAKQNFATEMDRLNSVIDATNTELRRGINSKKIEKEIAQSKRVAEEAGYVFSKDDAMFIAREMLGNTRKVNMQAKRNLKKLTRTYTDIEKTGGQKALVDEGARRAIRRESRGESLIKSVGDDKLANEREINKRIEAVMSERRQKALIRKADSKMRGSSGPRKSTKKKDDSWKKSHSKLEAAQKKSQDKTNKPMSEKDKRALSESAKRTRGVTVRGPGESEKFLRRMEDETSAVISRPRTGGKRKTVSQQVREEGGRLRPVKKGKKLPQYVAPKRNAPNPVMTRSRQSVAADAADKKVKKKIADKPRLGNVEGAKGPTGSRKIAIRRPFNSAGKKKTVQKRAKRK